MIENGIKAKWAAGQPTINGWLSIGNSFTAEVMAAQGYDSLTIDIQHGFLDYSDARTMLQALRASGATPLVRVPWNEPGIIMKSLDAGAYGIICPMVNSGAEAARFVDALRYPPRGNRSFGPTRVNFSAGDNYAAEANDQILGFAMIETAEAVENAAEICATPGLDGIYVGPSDLTLGVTQGRLPPGFDREEDEMIAVIQQVLGVVKAAGLRAALHCGTPEYAARAIGWGYDMVTLSGDVRLLSAAAAASLSAARDLIGQGGGPGASDPKGY